MNAGEGETGRGGGICPQDEGEGAAGTGGGGFRRRNGGARGGEGEDGECEEEAGGVEEGEGGGMEKSCLGGSVPAGPKEETSAEEQRRCNPHKGRKMAAKRPDKPLPVVYLWPVAWEPGQTVAVKLCGTAGKGGGAPERTSDSSPTRSSSSLRAS